MEERYMPVFADGKEETGCKPIFLGLDLGGDVYERSGHFSTEGAYRTAISLYGAAEVNKDNPWEI